MLEFGTPEYERRHTDWTRNGRLAYASTRTHLLTLFGGAKGGSKTVTGCRIFQTDIANYSGGLFVVMRRNYTALHITTKQSFERFFPPELIVKKTTDRWHCVNDNEILFWAADRTTDRDYEKTRGLEATALFVDEASQFDDEFYQIAPSLLRRPAHVLTHVREVIPDLAPVLRGYVYLTSNPVPGQNYLKRHFIDPRTRKNDARHCFIQALPDDNECLPDGYIDLAFGNMNGPMLQMLRFGDWDVEESDFVIIPAGVIASITVSEIIDRTPIAAGIDVGLGRPDATIVYFSNRAGETWREAIIDDEYDTMKIADRLLPHCLRVQSNGGKIAIDAGAVGKGVADRLASLLEWGHLMPVNFGESAVVEDQSDAGAFENRRAQLYWWARIDAEESAASGGSFRILDDDMLTEELANTYYVPQDGKLKLEAKKLIKERIGRSPDDADAFVLCNAARREARMMDFTLPKRSDRSRSPRRANRESSTTAGY